MLLLFGVLCHDMLGLTDPNVNGVGMVSAVSWPCDLNPHRFQWGDLDCIPHVCGAYASDSRF